MNLHECILTNNDCYKSGRKITPKGVMVHSTGANNPNLKRYVGPDDGLLGYNANNNHWNRSGLEVCVHAFIGKLADGTIATYQTLPWNYRGWHCGSGSKGSGNNTHISFEICEDALKDSNYFQKVYQEAVELTAYLCKMYNFNPLSDGVVICHSEGYKRGIASDHADVEHWFPKFGKTMDDFRADVASEMKGETKVPEETKPEETQGDDEEVTQDQFNSMMNVYLDELAKQEGSDWSQEEREWAESVGLIKGDQYGNKQYKNFCTREAMVVFLKRFNDMIG